MEVIILPAASLLFYNFPIVFDGHYDLIVIGGGHAGCEAASAAARMGVKTALFTINTDMIAQMSCNPAIGGIAKGHLVREIDALGGLMGEVTDRTGIQFRLLNRSRGPAVQSPRAQTDKKLYRREVQRVLRELSNLTLEEAEVTDLLREKDRITGVKLADGRRIASRAVIMTTGTFLNGLCHVGEQKFMAGRSGEKAAILLAESIRGIGFQMGRLKTGTPPRLDRASIDFSGFQIQAGDQKPTLFSFRSTQISQPQIHCWITYTSSAVHQAIRDHLHRSPLYSGQIEAMGPRYCPSIEDKVVKFPERNQHQLYLEPEGLDTDIIYLNGLSTSMPVDVQRRMLAHMAGLERAVMVRPGYAVEYDFVQPAQLHRTLETRQVEGLFHAGQINGTSGYEEAAAQGIIAGINAALKILGRDSFVLGRSEGYIGTLIDDLTTKGVDEPYRMFTSRAEYRLLVRIDNADRRLMPHGYRLGLIPPSVYQHFQKKWERIDGALEHLHHNYLKKDSPLFERLSQELGAPPGTRLENLLRRPQCGIRHLAPMLEEKGHQLSEEEQRVVEIQIKYEGYIQQQLRDVERLRSLEERRIPSDLNYQQIGGLSHEMVEKLSLVRPGSLGQASRIPGVTPAAVSILNIHLELRRRAGM